MAGLSNIEIKMERRLCTVDGELGYFHCWEHYSTVIEPSPMVGGYPGGTLSYVLGIVEFPEDVRKVTVDSIKFCDEENAMLAEMVKHMEDRKENEK